MWTSRKKKIDSSRICSSAYIISKKKRPVYMHIVIYIVILVVFCGLPGLQDKDDSARRIWIWILDIISYTWGMSVHAHVGPESQKSEKTEVKGK